MTIDSRIEQEAVRGTGAQRSAGAGEVRSATGNRRFEISVFLNERAREQLARDVRAGLTQTPKSLPPKYFYDALGSRLFDRICDTPEYYQTRTEQALLENIADAVVGELSPTHIVELGSGAARKTRVLLDALQKTGRGFHFVPFDVSESMLRASAAELLREYPWLHVHGIVGDYEHHLAHIPGGERRLFVFLGSTIGNFEPDAALDFVKRVNACMRPQDRLLLGFDLVKSERVLHAAYNDAQGITAEFNKNVLSVINRELGANFDLNRFAHVAFYDPAKSQIEMHLESSSAQRVHVARLELDVAFAEGERMRTEISRKFTRSSVALLLERSGQELVSWFSSADQHFALALTQQKG
ncbi:MAG TPA: L-histidine N(alpha)-methyltransferase [Polyangiaceae bacterium]|nr:L-histidine N(alpha)-methyltransferase [Polyangiaceae bacterium]